MYLQNNLQTQISSGTTILQSPNTFTYKKHFPTTWNIQLHGNSNDINFEMFLNGQACKIPEESITELEF